MARHARIIRVARDHFGDRWDIREERPTEHGWPLLFGWPSGFPRGRGGCGGPRLILSSPLVEYLESRRLKRGVELPIGSQSVKKLWRMIGRDYYGEVAKWWEDRADDLAELTLDEFSAKHHTKNGAVEMWRLRMFGKRLRDAAWWRNEPAHRLLVGAYPRAFVAEKLDISIGAVGRLRWRLRNE